VSAIDENVGRWDASALTQLGNDWIQLLPRDHQNVAGDDGQLVERFLFQHDGHRAKLALLAAGSARRDAASDDHGVVRLQLRSGTADSDAVVQARLRLSARTCETAQTKHPDDEANG